MAAKLTFLGTGTSQGVPMIGCRCDVCMSTDQRDKRLRSSVLVEYEGLTILVDAGPDFRQQMLAAEVSHLDAILLTHNHKDHTGGLDDIRAFNYLEKKATQIYCEKYVEDSLRQEYSYAFAENSFHIFLTPDAHDGRAGGTGIGGNGGNCHGDGQIQQTGAQNGGDDDGQQNIGQCHHHIDEAHDEGRPVRCRNRRYSPEWYP